LTTPIILLKRFLAEHKVELIPFVSLMTHRNIHPY